MLQMLNSQDCRIDRPQTGIRDDQYAQIKILDQIIQNHMLLIIPAQRADNPPAPFHRQILVPAQGPLKITLHTVKIHRTLGNPGSQMR